MKRPQLLWKVVDGVARAWVEGGAECGRCRRMAMFFRCVLGEWACVACSEGDAT